jgi:hypothetical protein
MAYNRKPLAAFSMGEYESLTRSGSAEFRKAGAKDKTKRKHRGAMIGGAIAGGLGLGAAGIRYGGAELKGRMADKKLSDMRKEAGIGGSVDYKKSQSLARESSQNRAGSRFGKDIEAIKSNSKKAYENIGKTASGIASGGKNKLSSIWNHPGGLGKAGIIAAGVGGAGAAGYGAYRLLNNKKKK